MILHCVRAIIILYHNSDPSPQAHAVSFVLLPDVQKAPPNECKQLHSKEAMVLEEFTEAVQEPLAQRSVVPPSLVTFPTQLIII